MNVVSLHKTCHVCQEVLPPPVIDLGTQPLCDDLVRVGEDRVAVSYPIQVSLCPKCLTAHQLYQVAKETLFPSSYHYRPRFTQDVLNGMKDLVDEYSANFGGVNGKLVCDVGCNDGSLLSIFRSAGGRTCGIEPTGAAAEAAALGHHVIDGYFSPETASQLIAKVGKPDVITFTNVFAHIESLREALDALKVMIHDRTVVVIENHYLGAVIEANQFDTFYHEHPRTYSYRSFEFIANLLGGEILACSFPRRYGGNIRVSIGNFNGARSHARAGATGSAPRDESAFHNDLERMQRFVTEWSAGTGRRLREMGAGGMVFCGKAFPARASILIHLLGLTERLQPVIYEKPGSLKLGHYVPGTKIEIVSDERWIKRQDEPPAILIWGWHIAEEIGRYLRTNGYAGRIFVPLPEFREIMQS